ncbi:MAG: DsbA family oxidoreductase [Pseudomonadota bacterium]
MDVISDVMCPWCYIGKRRLEKALAMVPDVAVDIRWRPYQLDNTIPESGMDRKEYLRNKFGSDEQAAQVYGPVRAAGKDEEIPFEFDKISISPNTLNAHRIIRWAMTEGVQDAAVERLFQLYFVEGANLTDRKVLTDAAVEAGLERAVVERLLESDADLEETKAEISQAQQMGVTGVPAFIIGSRYAVMGAREPEAIAQAIAEVAKERSAPAGNA